MAVSVTKIPWQFTAQGDSYTPDSPAYGPDGLVGVGIRPYIRRIVLVIAAEGTFDVRDELDGQSLFGLYSAGGATAPLTIDIQTQVKGIYIQALTGDGNEVLVYPGYEEEG
jgi:hypothetical protein